jgi:hypothetical protein
MKRLLCSFVLVFIGSCYQSSSSGWHGGDDFRIEGEDPGEQIDAVDPGRDDTPDGIHDGMDVDQEGIEEEIEVCGDGTLSPSEECDPPGSEEDCLTSCGSTGKRLCLPGCLWSDSCDPPREACRNGLDDDCDGSIDEMFEETVNAVPFETTGVSIGEISVLWTGSTLGISWGQRYYYGDWHADILFQQYNSDGLPIGPPTTVSDNPENMEGAFALSLDTSELLVVWGKRTMGGIESLWGRKLDLSGAVASEEILVADRVFDFPRTVPWADSSYAVSYVKAPSEGAFRKLAFRRFSSDLSPLSDEIHPDNVVGGCSFPSVHWTGSDFVLTWVDGSNTFPPYVELMLTRITLDGVDTLDDIPVSSPAIEFPSVPVLASNDLVFSWCERSGLSVDACWLRSVSLADYTAGSDVPLVCEPEGSRVWFPALLWNREVLFAAGACKNVETGSAEGMVSDMSVPPGYVMDRHYPVSDETSYYHPSPSIVWTGSDFGVAWVEQESGILSRIHLVMLRPACSF